MHSVIFISVKTAVKDDSSGEHAYAHLREVHAIVGAFDAIIISTAGETVPHRLYVRRDCRSSPVRITVVGNYASKMLELFVLKLHGTFQPVLAVKIHHDSALVKAPMALGEICLHDEAEILLTRLHLKDWCIIITEMIICPLPEIRMRRNPAHQFQL